MAITRVQKENIVEEGKKDLQESGVVLFTDYKGTSVSDLGILRTTLKEANAKMKVIKKRLLKIILNDSGVNFDPTGLEGQVAAVFARGDVTDIAGPIYNFAKTHEGFAILGGVNVREKVEIPLDLIIRIGTLPSREVLIAQLVGTIAAPLRGLMYVLKGKSEK
ncbi:MAG: 50S ribosomal protein L10 [Candidatus Colwellbacteria bacterium RIFCSPHIGHO2_02_FULL_45_17]|uniref:Large ribosomal subunit protein uL10 n=1 Tax=uncultured Parcubacteria bacterium Rifle_16ft_4_minimus_37647 TaxID=1665140 RepID=A0A0H4TP13_9BACT|nr:50S ribosomal protein L10, large subunit ribosomal protein L10 [uncultured Parcubacteria bacterium Rifle_16ft_4_minimus_37647]OGY57598.1 MAG: 50S ribosomal protein L10 [Candidatus Colwellbacteria bacterium RIFCSPHIGHO2_02_FULL_45_17]